MAEANGSSIGGGAGEYQPRHAAEQLDFGLMEALVHAADQYRYQQMHEEFDAKVRPGPCPALHGGHCRRSHI